MTRFSVMSAADQSPKCLLASIRDRSTHDGYRSYGAAHAAGHRRRSDRMRQREFIAVQAAAMESFVRRKRFLTFMLAN